ncbi:hypothetical protein BDN70DRAFT_872260 [Pholiota conissans]|uniref:Replication protein A C-terminal domain-containing protein n=1 Tax=Pholiota conissans TaxID=109636 RepID=A0A9P5ZAN5_9AGAR|nr:hypothetical protein BDN70DRAFT_872260 [Pholiota conissans]
MLVANVLSDDPDSKKLIMDDGTGKITGYREPKARIPTFVNLSYARIVAELRSNNERRSLQITHVRPVYDGHEIYHHILRAIADTLSLERGPPVYPPSNAEIAAIDVDTLTQDIEQLNISRNVFANCAPSLQHLQQEVILPIHDQHLEASSSRHDISASQQSNQRLLLQQDIINSLLDKEPQDSFSGVHVANFIPDIILKHETITADELNDALEDLLERNLITTVQDDEYFRCL